jgi:hypothetical protein
VKFHEEILINSLGDDSNNAMIVAKALAMALIANRIAYAVQYSCGEEMYFDDIDFYKFDSEKYFTNKVIEPIKCQESELYKKLSILHYNLYTNDGRIFLENKYTKNIEKMLACLNKFEETKINEEGKGQ